MLERLDYMKVRRNPCRGSQTHKAGVDVDFARVTPYAYGHVTVTQHISSKRWLSTSLSNVDELNPGRHSLSALRTDLLHLARHTKPRIATANGQAPGISIGPAFCWSSQRYMP